MIGRKPLDLPPRFALPSSTTCAPTSLRKIRSSAMGSPCGSFARLDSTRGRMRRSYGFPTLKR